MITNYSNQVITYPEYEMLSGSIGNNRAGLKRIDCAFSKKRDVYRIKAGYYFFVDASDQTSEIIEIKGVNFAQKQIILKEPISVSPINTDIKVVTKKLPQNICIYNNGLANIYVNGEVVLPGVKIYYTDKQITEPIVVYGSDSFQIAEGDISQVVGLTTLPANTSLVAVGVGDGTDTIVIPALIGVAQANLTTIITGNTNYTIGVEILSYDSVTGTFVMDGFNIDIGQKFYVNYLA